MRPRLLEAGRFGLFALLASALLSVASAGPASADSWLRHLCRHRRCVTLAASRKLRVVRATPLHPEREAAFAGAFAESFATHRRTSLGESEGTTTGSVIRKLALTGEYVACGLQLYTKEPETSWQAEVVNARTGRRRAASIKALFPNATGGVTSVAVTPGGTAAWIDGGTVTAPSLYEVVEFALGRAAPVVLATAPSVVPQSLAAAPGRIYWIEGEAARTVSVP